MHWLLLLMFSITYNLSCFVTKELVLLMLMPQINMEFTICLVMCGNGSQEGRRQRFHFLFLESKALIYLQRIQRGGGFVDTKDGSVNHAVTVIVC